MPKHKKLFVLLCAAFLVVLVPLIYSNQNDSKCENPDPLNRHILRTDGTLEIPTESDLGTTRSLFVDRLRRIISEHHKAKTFAAASEGIASLDKCLSDSHERLTNCFVNGTIPYHVNTIEGLHQYVLALHSPDRASSLHAAGDKPSSSDDSAATAKKLFSYLNYELEPECINKKENYWYRKEDGSCNWLKKDNSHIGSYGWLRPRDYNQTAFADGVSMPREGPNPREVSNAFFQRKKTIYYEHTPILLGLIEFVMHDITYSQDSETEVIAVPIPKGDPWFDPHSNQSRFFHVKRAKHVPGTGTSRDNPRQNANMATAWLDLSSLYGSTKNVSDSLRTFRGGKLLTTMGSDGREYLPYNTFGLPMRTRPGVPLESLFAGGDPRTNEDWVMLSVHTLLLREHNRLAEILQEQKPSFSDEEVYQTVKLLMSSKFALIANSYQMAYFTDEMPEPRDDGFPLYRQMFDANDWPVIGIGPFHKYPWKMVTKGGIPQIASQEMAIAYRFHEFIINSFPIKDNKNVTVREQNLFNTAFDSKGFIETGMDDILRGLSSIHIPNFKSGVDEAFRSAGAYRGAPLDLVVWSIVHEREEGIPSFNVYFDAYNRADPRPALQIKIRKRFEDFTSDPEMVRKLKKLYSHPDEVDLVVGTQLDEEYFPGTTVPKSALIVSLFSLFGVGNSDRFSPGFASLVCLLSWHPWDCHPTNALEDLLWEPRPTKHFPNFRWYNTFWAQELDLEAHGRNLLWRLVTENSGVKCLQRNPLFPFDETTNPVLCSLQSAQKSEITDVLPALEWHWWVMLGATLMAVLITLFYWFC